MASFLDIYANDDITRERLDGWVAYGRPQEVTEVLPAVALARAQGAAA
jgi:hypothetical protein